MDDKKMLLEIKNLKVQYATNNGIVHAVENLNMILNTSETLGFVGETGAGKTTTALSIMGLLPKATGKVVEGEILYKNENLLLKSNNEMRAIRGGEIAMIFQDPMTSLDPVQRVGNQIAEMILLHEKVDKKEAMEKAKKLLVTVGIRPERIYDYPHQFSGGMKQRVVIAIALACNPNLLIADEPTTALDVTIQAQVLELMKNLKKEFGASMIMITHDLGIVADICDKVAIMYAGSVVEYSDMQDLYENPCHPYTKGLFNSIPDIFEENIERLKEIKGLPPNNMEPSVGCSFYPRCENAMDKCKIRKPKVCKITDSHYVNCCLYE